MEKYRSSLLKKVKLIDSVIDEHHYFLAGVFTNLNAKLINKLPAELKNKMVIDEENEHEWEYYGADSHHIFYTCAKCGKKVDQNPDIITFSDKDKICYGTKSNTKDNMI